MRVKSVPYTGDKAQGMDLGYADALAFGGAEKLIETDIP